MGIKDNVTVSQYSLNYIRLVRSSEVTTWRRGPP